MKTIVILARIIAFFMFALFALRAFASAQAPPPVPDVPVDAATRTAVIDNLIKELNDSYIFAETAKKMETDLRERIKNREYDTVTTSKAFTEKLTADVQSVSHDKHLRIRYSPDPIPERKDDAEPTAEEKAQEMWFAKRRNFGFNKVERLDGNIGYIEFSNFFDPEGAEDTVASAFNFLSNTDALIIDLRQNGGGDPAMVALICSYLFGDKPVHLNDLYWRKGNKTDEFWTKAVVAGKRFTGKDVYVLTSNRTFSGAEEFSYNLKNLKRATIVGETTGGGAHPGGMVRLSEHYAAFVPIGRAISPITKTNWEGTGVEPDVKAPKEQALKIAYIAALTRSAETIKDEAIKAGIKQIIDRTQKELDDMKQAKK